MDWNRDGKVDAKDSAIFHEVINKESSNCNNTNNTNRNHSTNGNGNSNNKTDITQLGKAVLTLIIIMLLLIIFTGAGFKVFVTTVEIGLIVFFIAQWLDS